MLGAEGGELEGAASSGENGPLRDIDGRLITAPFVSMLPTLAVILGELRLVGESWGEAQDSDLVQMSLKLGRLCLAWISFGSWILVTVP